jgi:hypothetical protein
LFVQGDFFWWLNNPFVNGLLSMIFGIFTIISVGLLIMSLIKLTFARNRIGPLIGIALSLLFIGDLMGKVVQGIGYYFEQMITYWLLSMNLPASVATFLL